MKKNRAAIMTRHKDVKHTAEQGSDKTAAAINLLRGTIAAIEEKKTVGGTLSQQTLVALVPCMVDTLQSNDWTIRKAAAEAFGCMALSLGPFLSSFKASCVAALESCRFDKVKPVRDTVVQTLQAWKSIPDAEVSSPLTEKGSTSKGTENSSIEAFPTDNKSACGTGRNSTFLRKSGSAVTKSATDGISVSTAKKRTPLTDTKINQNLPRKLDCRKTDHWHVEVAVPRKCLPISVIHNEEFNTSNFSNVSGRKQRASNIDDNYRFGDSETFGKMDTSRLSDESRASCETKCILVDDGFEEKSSMRRTPSSKLAVELTALHNNPPEQSSMNKQNSDCLVSESNTKHNAHFVGETTTRTAEDLAFIRKQLSQIENQQLSLMELLQAFMGSSLESISTVETRVHGLERIVNEMAQDLGKSPGRMASGDKCHRSLGAEMLRSKYWKRKDRTHPSSRLGSSDTIPSIHKFGREAPYKSEFSSTDSCENSKYAHLQSSFMVRPLVDAWELSYRGHVNSSPDTAGRHMPGKVETNQSPPRPLDRTTRKDIFSKDILVGGGCLTYMDESSLSGTYSTAEDTQKKMTEVRNSGANLSGISSLSSRLTSMDESSLPGMYSTAENMQKKMEKIRNSTKSLSGTSSLSSSYENGHFWSVWTRAVEYLCADKIDLAFVEVLCSEDDLLLIQLMRRTGPVLGKLSQVTTLEILQSVMRLLLDQIFLDTIIPWLQQMGDLISSNGPDYLGLSLGEKMETLYVLQEASSMQFSDLSSWRFVVQIASKLANAWAADLRSIYKQE
ncbi:hypothetical protein KI387_009773 [Taxus chinensis]|uniref:Uncharacterized protein n=1 Tax=Taxus chinensis TaxID=29808 RepID=A0AA38FJW4_TAXCH|nr:hypothetical protein KI387_009773 [Taxus chinensis]